MALIDFSILFPHFSLILTFDSTRYSYVTDSPHVPSPAMRQNYSLILKMLKCLWLVPTVCRDPQAAHDAIAVNEALVGLGGNSPCCLCGLAWSIVGELPPCLVVISWAFSIITWDIMYRGRPADLSRPQVHYFTLVLLSQFSLPYGKRFLSGSCSGCG